jgi:hypothetical protein
LVIEGREGQDVEHALQLNRPLKPEAGQNGQKLEEV